ncbi:MAG: GntR family transcriptional regulator [Coprococcus sp.]
MVGKMDQVLEYIEALLPGARVSVRQLAKELSVSEGTAYKAIRCAKEKGLVQSKPKSGTVRIASDNVHNEKARPAEDFVSDRAGDWMQEPLYLYHDDVAADWHRLYRGMFSAFSKCAVVDDDRKVCGTVDALQVNSAELTSKISSMYMSEGSCLVEDEDIPVSVLADSMAKANTSLAYLTRNGVVSGVITASDLLRYYRLKVKGDFIVGDAAVFEVVGYNKKIGQIEYRVQLSHANQAGTRYPTGVWLSILTRAAGFHGQEIFGGACECGAGSFYMICEDFDRKNLKVISEIDKQEERSCVLLVALYDEEKCCARGTFMIHCMT